RIPGRRDANTRTAARSLTGMLRHRPGTPIIVDIAVVPMIVGIRPVPLVESWRLAQIFLVPIHNKHTPFRRNAQFLKRDCEQFPTDTQKRSILEDGVLDLSGAHVYHQVVDLAKVLSLWVFNIVSND